MPEGSLHSTEVVELDQLRPHPRNYRQHPDDQLAHIEHSLVEHGQYRNVVVARDGTVLAGHGVVAAAKRLGWTQLQVIRLDIEPDDPRALRIVPGDNEMGRLAIVDDRALAELLRDLYQAGSEQLLGTGFDEAMLVNLLTVTRPASEIADSDAAAEWLGLPAFDADPEAIRLTLHFDSEAERDKFVAELGVTISNKVRHSWSAWWPPRPLDDPDSAFFDG